MQGQIYVEKIVPENGDVPGNTRTPQYPIVFLTGGSQTATVSARG